MTLAHRAKQALVHVHPPFNGQSLLVPHTGFSSRPHFARQSANGPLTAYRGDVNVPTVPTKGMQQWGVKQGQEEVALAPTHAGAA